MSARSILLKGTDDEVIAMHGVLLDCMFFKLSEHADATTLFFFLARVAGLEMAPYSDNQWLLK